MGAAASLSLCQTQSSVRVLKQNARVEPEPRPPQPVPGAIFGVPLAKLREAGKLQHGIPLVLKNMVEFLEKYGLQQSGVFRVCGSVARCRTLRVCLDHEECVDLERADVPTVAALLKLYLRELPSGLIPNTLSKHMQHALMNSKNKTELFERLKKTLSRLPDENYNILSYLLHFLSRVAAHSQWNHMTSENLATVFGPCIFRVPEGPRMLEEQTVCNTLTLHLLEKHRHLIPNTHSHTHEEDLPLQSPPPFADMTQQLEELCSGGNLDAVCDVSIVEVKERNGNLLTTTKTKPLSSSGGSIVSSSDITDVEKSEEEERMGREEKETEANKEQRINLKQESCFCKEEEFCIQSDMSMQSIYGNSSLQLCAVESPNSNNNNKHSNPSHTHTHCGNTHSQSSSTRSGTRHTRSKTRKRSSRSRTHTPDSNTHSEPSHTLSQTNISHTPSELCHTHTHTVTTHKEEEPSPASSLSNRAPVWKMNALPSPHCPILSQNLHLSSNQSSASSNQSQIIRGNSVERSDEISSSLLQHHIHNLKETIWNFNESFQHTNNYKASHSNKTEDSKVASLIMEHNKAHVQVKELQSRQYMNELNKSRSSSTTQQEISMPQSKPALEETVKTLQQHLKEKRQELYLPECVQDMSRAQLALEKTTLQKSLLFYESLHGRPRSREEKNVMRELYDRYRLVKHAFYSSNKKNTSTRENEDSVECIQQSLVCMVSVPTPEDSKTASISQLEVKETFQTNDTKTDCRAELLRQLNETRGEKRKLRKILKEYKETVYLKTGRRVQKEDWVPMTAEYSHYKALKARLKSLRLMLEKTNGPNVDR